MTTTVAIVSQKGGVGKSTLTRALAQKAMKSGLSVKVADLDTQQGTVSDWHRNRLDRGYDPIGSVEVFRTARQALRNSENYDLLILDGAPRASTATLEIAKEADLVIQPTGASLDDLKPAVLLFHELTNRGVPKNCLAFALFRVGTEAEAQDAVDYIEEAGYSVLEGFLYERPAYRQAQNEGLSITETRYNTLNKRAEKLIDSITCLLLDG
jgi:chromosome partitioning protein